MQKRNLVDLADEAEAARSARASEAAHPGRSTCLNCGASLRGAYCHRCGQEDRDPEPALREWISDFLEAALNWDSRVLRTIRELLLRPGRTAAEYNAGRRASYASPLRMYVAVSVIFLAGATLAGGRFMGEVAISAGADQVPAPDAWPWMVRGFVWSMFLLVPAFAGLLKLLYIRSGRAYVHHLVFAVYYHAFAFLVLAPLVWLAFLAPGVWLAFVTGAVFLWVMAWLPFAMRRAYGQGWVLTAVKGMALLWMYFSFIVPLASVPMALLLVLVLGGEG